MRIWRWLLVIAVIVGIGVAVYLLKPDNGPARDLTLVGDATRGAYLIKVGGCVACHTDTKGGGAVLAGGLPIVTPFGSFIPPNITSDPDAGIGKWTLAQFSDALSSGEGPQGHLYPAFPFTSYTTMTDQDMADLFAAMKAVPAVAKPSAPHQVSFPFSIRLANLAWKNLFFIPHRFAADPAHSALWNRGAYLASGPAHCVECHSPRNIFGAIDKGKEFTGSPKGSLLGRVPPLTKDDLTTDLYDEPGLIASLKSGFTPAGDALGHEMAEVIKDSTSLWTDDDRHAVAAYLLGLEQ